MKRLFLAYILLAVCTLVQAQSKITGVVVDAVTGDSIPLAGAVYRTHGIQVAAGIDGCYTVPRHNGWTLFFTALGYKTKEVKVTDRTPSHLVVKLRPDTKQLGEVVITGKSGKYSRKNNPAVELMKRVIEQKKKTDLAQNNFYQFYKYQKLTLARNNITTDEIANMRENGKRDWLVNQTELCPMNGKMILPLQVGETVERHIYRKNPRQEKTFILGQSSSGVANLVETAGSILEATMRDVFTDVDIYDDQIRLLQYPFTSPIGKDAIGFYRYYITDTLMVGKDPCYALSFVPNNQQDMGFRGDIYILADSTLHVRKVSLTIPKQSNVNFVDHMKIDQEYVQLPDGQWVLDTDNMLVEMSVNRFLTNAVVIRTTKLSDYSFADIPKNNFRGAAETVIDPDSRLRGSGFWNRFRTVDLTKGEKEMGGFVSSITSLKGMNYVLFGLKALMNNYIETTMGDSVKSKFDFGPVNTLINRNIIDGYRVRLSGRTTAALNKHLFWDGYIARGFDSHKWYYNTSLTWAFNKKENEPWEFPIRQLKFTTEYDIMSPNDMFLATNKDNIFTSFRVKKIDKMYFYNRQNLEFKWENTGGFATTARIETKSVEGAAKMQFLGLDGSPMGNVRTTSAGLSFRYAPGETYINTKQRRYPINFDVPIITFGHTISPKGVLGSNYTSNMTEASLYRRIWLNSWGKLDLYATGGIQWDKVPFPLLCMPHTNLSWFSGSEQHNFQLMNNMEFLNDRFVMWDVRWDLNGKLLNRLPLVRKLKWREVIGVRGMVGWLTDKNNPFLPQNAGDNVLMQFPEGVNVMGRTPYWEASIGLHNIFKFLEVDFIHRFTYNDLDTAIKNGVRFAVNMTF